MRFTEEAISEFINAAKDVEDLHRRKTEAIQQLVDNPFAALGSSFFVTAMESINKHFKEKRLKFNLPD